MKFFSFQFGKVGLASIFVIVATFSGAHASTVLVTEQEAALPPATQSGGTRGILRGPRIELDDIDKDELQSPVRLKIRFQAFGDTTIDLRSLQVIYLKMPAVDLTSRVMPFAQPTGIDMPDAELPPGEHKISIEISDSDGHIANRIIALHIR